MKMTKNSVASMKAILLTTLLLGVCGAFAQTNEIFPRQGTVWKYNQTNDLYTDAAITNEAPNNWTLYDYDDSGPSWQEGPALLSNERIVGGGNGAIIPLIGTDIRGPREIPPVQHARFFRKKFTYSGPPLEPHTQFHINYRFDDGAVIWLNGTEIGRVNYITASPLTFTSRSDCYSCATPGTCTAGPSDPECELTTNFVATALLQGDNIIAVAVHQTGNDSSDITMGMSLAIVPPRFPTILSNSEPADRVVIKFRNTTLRVYAEASPAPTYQWYKDDVAITDATGTSHAITNMSLGDQGAYYAVVSNPMGSVTSRVAQVTYSEDTNAPVALQVTGSPSGVYLSVQFNEVMDENAAGEEFNFSVTRLDMAPPGNELTKMAADRSSDGASTIITLDPAEMALVPPNTPINVFIQGLFDLAGNFMDETNLQFNTFVPGCSTAILDMFNTGAGNTINLLLNHPTFINNTPYYSTNGNELNSDPVLPLPDNRVTFPSREAYGGRIRGIWIPPYNGDWVLYLRSDDAGELYLNPNGTDPAGKIRVAQQTACCNMLGDTNISSKDMQLHLIGGKPYYVEAVYKEGTGGDYVQIGAGIRGAGGIAPISALELGQFAPAGSGGVVTVDQHPANQTVNACTPVTFTARASSSQPGVPVCYQWQRGEADILGANSSSYSFIPDLSDDGAQFRVRVTVMGGDSEVSNPAVLDVQNDVDPPLLVSASTDVNRTNVIVTYNEMVDPASATTTANYSIPGATISQVVASGVSAVNLLLAAPLNTCQTYNVSVSNVRDRCNNVIAPNSSVSFTAPLVLLPINASHSWRFDESGEELGSAWFGTDFNDSSWSNGVPVFGVETDTALPAGYPIRQTHIWPPVKFSLYYRTHFNLPTGPSTVSDLVLQHIIDDGAVFYLNGRVLTGVRMGTEGVTTNMMATGATEPHVLASMSVPTSALRQGDNVLAARVHQSSDTSSDTVFAAGLIARITGCRDDIILTITRDGTRLIISSTGAGTIYKSSSLGGSWTVVGPAPQTVDADQGQQFFMIR